MTDDEAVQFVCTACGKWSASRIFEGSEVANLEAELGRLVEIDEREQYVNCTECGAWCEVDED